MLFSSAFTNGTHTFFSSKEEEKGVFLYLNRLKARTGIPGPFCGMSKLRAIHS